MIRYDRKAAKGIQFHSRRHGGTILPNLNGIWGEGGQKWSPGNARFKRTGGDPILVADDNLHPSVKVYTPSADTAVSLDKPAVLKERTS
jgi:hypothetical protein